MSGSNWFTPQPKADRRLQVGLVVCMVCCLLSQTLAKITHTAKEAAVLSAGIAAGTPPSSLRRLLQVSNCTTPSRCGPSCEKCTYRPPNGRPACLLLSEGYRCDYMCYKEFVKANVNGTAGCQAAGKPKSTGLTTGGKGLGTSPKKMKARYTGLIAKTNKVRNSGAASPEGLRKAVCGNTTCNDYEDVLLHALAPTAYSSNNTADTGGYAFISPAQQQGTCQSCVGFAATAAAEAAINVVRRQNWDKIGLSEQDACFCKMTVNCELGYSYEELRDSVNNRKLQQWASRECYPYKERAQGNCRSMAAACSSTLPAGEELSMAYDGSPLPSIAQVKEQIMAGGVMTSMVVLRNFEDYSPSRPNHVYTSAVRGTNQHAVFCYGWNDTGGWFECKNSWGPEWGWQGTFKVAYGAAYIMQPDSTFALRCGLPVYEREAQILDELYKNSKLYPSGSSDNSTCVLYTPKEPLRLMQLQRNLASIAPISIPRLDILADLISNNMQRVGGLAVASTEPVKICGKIVQLFLEGSRNFSDCKECPNKCQQCGMCASAVNLCSSQGVPSCTTCAACKDCPATTDQPATAYSSCGVCSTCAECCPQYYKDCSSCIACHACKYCPQLRANPTDVWQGG